MSEKITIHDLVTYHYVENLQYSPDGKTLAWQVAYADEKKNTYKRDVWVLRDNRPVQLTSTLNASIVCWEDDNTLLLQRSTADTAALTTDLYRIHLDGGEAVRAFTLPFAMSSMKKVKDGVYAALGTI
ncbi:MAG: S9 family peptidase, partial [Lactimicrobium massiliense]|nr:S9 family peptidase [Lactimicrobium massiliense]